MLDREINGFTLQTALAEFDDSHRQETDPKYLDQRRCNAMHFTRGADDTECTVTLNIAGIQVMNILLDTGAQPNLISIGALLRLGSLSTGAGIREAMKGMVRDLSGSSRITGITGHATTIIGRIQLPVILSKTKTIQIPFMVTMELKDSMVLGTPGLRALSFRLTSNLMGKRDYLDPNYRPSPDEEKAQKDMPTTTAHMNDPDALLKKDAKRFNQDQTKREKKKPGRAKIPAIEVPKEVKEEKRQRGRPKKKKEEVEEKNDSSRDPSPEAEQPTPETLAQIMTRDKETLKNNKHIDIDPESGELIAVKKTTADVKDLDDADETPDQQDDISEDERDFFWTGAADLNHLKMD
jgi:hypothetical protein